MSALTRDPLAIVRDALEHHDAGPRGPEHKFTARCPAHDDRNASLSVGAGHDGRALVHCHTGCSTADVLDALGLEVRALFAEEAKPWSNDGLRRTGASFDRDGRVRLGGTRYLPDPPDGTAKALAAPGSSRDLWPDPATVEGGILLVVEGEPDAVTGATLGLPAVSVPGAGKWRPEWAARLAEGRERVVVIPDADKPGRTAAQRVAAAVAEHCSDVRVLDLAPERDDGYDLSDYAAGAQDDREREQAAALILRAAGDVPRQGVSGVNPLGSDTLTPPPSGHAPTANGGPPKPDRYAERVLDVAGMLAEPDTPIPWRCHGLAADGYLTVLAGRGGEGKSWMALALACGVARGKPAAGIDCRQGRALIFDAENGPKLIARRLRAAEVTPDLHVQPVDAGGLTVAKDLTWMRQTIRGYRANLVVLDSLRVLSSGAKESDADEMEPLVTALKQLARDTGAALVLVHHRGKSETSEYRGSSVIVDQTDMLYTLGRVAGDPEGRHRRKITTIKCRIDEEPPPRWVAIDADRSRGLVFVNEAESYEPDDAGRPRDTLRDDVLGALGGIRQSQARIARAVGRDAKDQSVRRVLRDLEDAGLAVHGADGWGVSTPAPLGVDTLTPPLEIPVDTGSEGVSGGVSDGPTDAEPRRHVDGGAYEPPPAWMPSPNDPGELA